MNHVSVEEEDIACGKVYREWRSTLRQVYLLIRKEKGCIGWVRTLDIQAIRLWDNDESTVFLVARIECCSRSNTSSRLDFQKEVVLME